MNENLEKIQQLREAIDAIDREITGLLDRRMGLAYEIGLLKARENMEVFAEQREKQIHEQLRMARTEHISTEELFRLFEAIIEVGRSHGYRAKGM